MAKIVKRKNKRKLGIEFISVTFFSVACLAWLASSLFVNTLNTNLSIKIQKMQSEINELTNQNQDLNFSIQSLENKDRVYVIAQAANLEQIQENIVSVQGE